MRVVALRLLIPAEGVLLSFRVFNKFSRRILIRTKLCTLQNIDFSEIRFEAGSNLAFSTSDYTLLSVLNL